MRSIGTLLAGCGGKMCLQAQSLRRDGEDSGVAEEGEVASPPHSSSLHIAPPAREIQEAPVQHTVDKADIVKGYEYEKGKYGYRPGRRN